MYVSMKSVDKRSTSEYVNALYFSLLSDSSFIIFYGIPLLRDHSLEKNVSGLQYLSIFY
jgi:hypothetical protein